MELMKTEEKGIQEERSVAANEQILELAESQLFLVGGGVGEVGLN